MDIVIELLHTKVQDESHSNLLMSFQTRVKELITPSDVANLMELDFDETLGGKVPLSNDEMIIFVNLVERHNVKGQSLYNASVF